MKLSPKNLSILIAVLIAIWIASGFVTGASYEDSGSEGPKSGGQISKLVKVEALSAQPFTRQVVLNGIIEANRVVQLKPEVEGKVVELPVKKGQLVSEGQVIVRLDQRDRKEKLAEANAKLNARSIEYKASQQLEQKGYRPRIGLADAKAQLEQARVELAQAQLNFDNTLIKAPFAGRLEQLNVEIGDFILSGFFGSMDGKAMALLVEDHPVKMIANISEKDLPAVDVNAEATVILSDARSYTGRVTFLSQYADKDSRSFRVEVSIDNPNHEIPVGVTATMKLSASAGRAYQVSSSVLALDDMGKVGVKTVDAQGIVQFMPVTILSSNEEGLWISGLPDQVNLVVQGQAFVNAGQAIAPQEEKP